MIESCTACDGGKSVDQRSVLFLLNSLIVGGSERKTVRLANALKKRGWDVHIAYIDSLKKSPAPLLDEVGVGIPVRCLGRRWPYSVPAAFRLLKYILAQRISVVVCVNLYPLSYIAAISPWLNRRSMRWLSLVNSTKMNKKKKLVFSCLYKRLLKRVNFLVFGCQYQRNMWIDLYGLSADYSTHIYNGTDPELFYLDPESVQATGAEAGRKDCVVIGTVGQLRQEKNHRELLLACAPLLRGESQIQLILVGDGPERASLQTLAENLHMEKKVIFHGEVADVRPAIAKMDLFVLTSTTETFSNAALEAMSMSRAVVMSRVGGAAEMVTDGHDGYLYPAGRPEVLRALLERLISDRGERRRIGANARKTIEARFTLDRMVLKYERLLAGCRPGHCRLGRH